jgi:hypothetical protein
MTHARLPRILFDRRVVRLYLDTNVYAHARESGQQEALTRWLTGAGHRVVLSDVLLGEAIAIPDPEFRDARLRFLAQLPWRKTRALGYLQAMEFVGEVRRVRPQWRRLPVGDLAMVNKLREAQDKGWRILRRVPERLIDHIGNFRDIEEQAIRGSRVGQKTMRDTLLSGYTLTSELVLGSSHIPVRRLDLADEDDFCRVESAFAWYAAMVQELLTVSDYRNHAEPYVDPRKLSEADFARFWVDDVDLQRMPRGLATSIVIHAQLSSKIAHGNAADSRHAGYLTDADLFITEDQAFHAALQRVAQRVPDAAVPRLINRADSDLVAALRAAVASSGKPTTTK